MDCLNKKITTDIYSVKCNSCGAAVSEFLIKEFIGHDKYDQIICRKINEQIPSINCKSPNCNEQIVFEKGKVDYKAKDDEGKIMSKQACEDYANNRCRCPTCKSEMCISCGAIPYHKGNHDF